MSKLLRSYSGKNSLHLFSINQIIPYFLFALVLIFASCKNSQTKKSTQTDNNINPKYAKGFNIDTSNKKITINIFNPWQGAHEVVYKYSLVNKKNPDFNKVDNPIPYPVKRVICMSSSHVAFIDALGQSNTLVGLSGTKYVYNPNINKEIDSGALVDVGYDQGLNYELITSLKPDVILCYGVSEESLSYLNKLKELGLHVMLIGDYLENEPLGKTEWIKVFGYLFGVPQKADSIFNIIEQKYNSEKTIASKYQSGPTVFLNTPFRDVWYFPGNDNYFVKMIKDAGGRYLFNNLKGSQSYPISTEIAYKSGLNADVWINTGTAHSKADILNFDPRFATLAPFAKDKIYNNYKRMNKNGGNDFWESGTLNPHLILHDLVTIFHNVDVQDSCLYYYSKLK